mmetsp:Transcript_1818/g.6694  ORF Transcript_1818/g.6694 Transcript_1818/m.6694 type:complete len:407 (+) Transcript_1818:1243-2463(+)
MIGRAQVLAVLAVPRCDGLSGFEPRAVCAVHALVPVHAARLAGKVDPFLLREALAGRQVLHCVCGGVHREVRVRAEGEVVRVPPRDVRKQGLRGVIQVEDLGQAGPELPHELRVREAAPVPREGGLPVDHQEPRLAVVVEVEEPEPVVRADEVWGLGGPEHVLGVELEHDLVLRPHAKGLDRALLAVREVRGEVDPRPLRGGLQHAHGEGDQHVVRVEPLPVRGGDHTAAGQAVDLLHHRVQAELVRGPRPQVIDQKVRVAVNHDPVGRVVRHLLLLRPLSPLPPLGVVLPSSILLLHRGGSDAQGLGLALRLVSQGRLPVRHRLLLGHLRVLVPWGLRLGLLLSLGLLRLLVQPGRLLKPRELGEVRTDLPRPLGGAVQDPPVQLVEGCHLLLLDAVLHGLLEYF